MNHFPSIDWDLLPGAYSLENSAKQAFLMPYLDALTRQHYRACVSYRNIVDQMFGGLPPIPYQKLEDLPFFPVSLFKERELVSSPPSQIFKILTSSGTTGQSPSRILLDRYTADAQARALVKIMQYHLGKSRLPMIILDHPGVIRNREEFSARGAGILGLMQFGRNPCYALKEDMSLDLPLVANYVKQNQHERILFFGFTFMVWQHVLKPLMASANMLNAPNGSILVHSGGWKKIESEKVSQSEFSSSAKRLLGADRVINFYGMVEQVGSVFLENEVNSLQTPIFADVLVRHPQTLRPLAPGEPGLLQVFSMLPHSYPGHSLLTSDIGQITGLDDLKSGALGRHFVVLGRAPRVELRGCSDTYEHSHSIAATR